MADQSAYMNGQLARRWTMLVFLCCWAATWGLPARADSPATRPSAQDMATPRDALMAYDHWCVDLQDFDDAPAFYTATTDDEKAYVRQSMKYARVSAAIERLSRKAFGTDSCTAIMHEYGDSDVPDIRSAAITVNGNTATVNMPAVQSEFRMVKVDDSWLIDTSYLIRISNGLDNAVQASNSEIVRLQPIVDGLQAGNFKTAQDVIRAIDQGNAGLQK
jgi:hypothetical protein